MSNHNELNIGNQKSTFDIVPIEIRKTVNIKYTGLLSMIASLSFNSGFCNASDNYLISNSNGMTSKKIRDWLDWLEDNGLIVRYNQLNMVNNEFPRTKRLIVLSEYTYKIYKNVNSKMHEPIECPKGFLIHSEFLKRTKRNKKATKQHASNRDAKLSSKQTEHLKASSDDATNNASEDLKQQEQPKNEHISQSKDDASSLDVFLNKQGIATKNDSNRHPKKVQPKRVFSNDKRNAIFIKFCNYYQKKGYDDYVQRATDKLNKLEQQAINSKG